VGGGAGQRCREREATKKNDLLELPSNFDIVDAGEDFANAKTHRREEASDKERRESERGTRKREQGRRHIGRRIDTTIRRWTRAEWIALKYLRIRGVLNGGSRQSQTDSGIRLACSARSSVSIGLTSR